MAVKVGSFAKKADGTGTQAITGVGFQPKALLLWTVGATANDTYAAHIRSCIGLTDGTTAGACAASLDDNTANTNAGRNTATAAFCIVDGDGTVIAEADLSSFGADGFTLNWTTNDANATIINYVALAGASLSNVKVLEWQLATSTGNQGVTGVGFQPDALLTVCGSRATRDSGTTGAHLVLLGAVGTAEWSSGWSCANNQLSGVGYVLSRSGVWVDALASVDYQGTITSLDADGFTVNWSSAASDTFYAYTLCLKGGSYAAGQVDKAIDAAPVTQQITGLGFTPELGLFGMGNDNNNGYGLCLVIGASDGTNERCGLMTDEYGKATVEAKHYTSNSKVLVQDYSETTGSTPDQSTDSEADFGGFGVGTMDLDWTTNDANASNINYFAFAGGAAATAKARAFAVIC